MSARETAARVAAGAVAKLLLRTVGIEILSHVIQMGPARSDKWHEEMDPAPGATKSPLTQVRPGHADLAGMQKYGFTDARDVLERASARETAARVAAGTLAKKLLATRPSATRAAVSRAEARSSTGRASSKSYFCMPARSA